MDFPWQGQPLHSSVTEELTKWDADGKFFIRASEREILPISYLGYTAKDCKVGSAPSISEQEGFSK